MADSKWLPRPISWFRAITLLLATVPLVWVLRMVAEGAFNALEVGRRPENWLAWAIVAGIVAPIYVLGFVEQWLWGNPPKDRVKWLPDLKSLREGLFSWIVILMGILLFFIIPATVRTIVAIEASQMRNGPVVRVVPNASYPSPFQQYFSSRGILVLYQRVYRSLNEMPERRLGPSSGATVAGLTIFMAYCYHLRSLAVSAWQQWREKARKQPPSPFPKLGRGNEKN